MSGAVVRVAVVASAFAACAGAHATPPAPAPAAVVTFEGACDASGAVPLDARRFAVADDEDNVLRVYDAERGGPPLEAVDLSDALGLRGKKKAREADLEGATRLGDRAYFITSHGRNSRGKLEPGRLQFFATTVHTGAPPASMALVGTPCTTLLEQILALPASAAFGLAAAAERAPKEPGGLAIEGLTATPDGRMLIGFRSPLASGRALVLPLENPRGVTDGAPARFGPHMLLDLGGLGVRALSTLHGSYLVAAGPPGGEGPRRIYTWSGAPGEAPRALVAVDDVNPEGFFTPEERTAFMVLSDDGERIIDGVACKKLKDGARKRFRGRWIDPGKPR